MSFWVTSNKWVRQIFEMLLMPLVDFWSEFKNLPFADAKRKSVEKSNSNSTKNKGVDSTYMPCVITKIYLCTFIFSGRVPLLNTWNVSLQLFFKTWKVARKNILFSGKTIIGDNTYIHRMYMAVHLKVHQIRYKDN